MNNKAEAVGHFKSVKGRHAGQVQVVQFHRVMSDGMIKTVDIVRRSTKTNRSFGSFPLTLEASTEEEFLKHYNQVVNLNG